MVGRSEGNRSTGGLEPIESFRPFPETDRMVREAMDALGGFEDPFRDLLVDFLLTVCQGGVNLLGASGA